MKLRSKIHFVIAAIILLVVMAALLIERAFVLEKFREVEDTWMAENILRAENAVADEISYLDSHAKDWGWWDATYDFVVTLDPEYSSGNFNASSLVALAINDIIYLNADRKIVSSAGVDLKKAEMVEVPKALMDGIAAESVFFEPKSFKDGVRGIATYDGIIYLLSARQILTSDGRGPSHGTIIMVRTLDEQLIKKWEQLVQRELRIRKIDDPDLPMEVSASLTKNNPASPPLIIPYGDESIAGFAIIRDIRNNPAFIMEVMAPRNVWAYANAAILYSSVSLIILAVLSFGITVLLLRRDLLAHLAQIDNEEIRRSERELRQANEELERVNKARMDFTSMVSHELRTPLGTIKQAIEIMLEGIDGPLAEKQAERLGVAKRNVERLVKLTNDILDLSRLETGRIQMEFEETDLKNVLEEVYALMKPAADAKSIAFSLDLPDRIIHAMCDGDKIRQTAINLVGNAIKFTNAGGTIELGLSDEGKDIRIAVADTGLGIAEDQISKLFQPFSQLRGVNYRPGEGSGLGLSICKQIVQAHGGRIGLESEPGKGSTFSVFLPKAGPTDTIDQSISLSEGI